MGRNKAPTTATKRKASETQKMKQKVAKVSKVIKSKSATQQAPFQTIEERLNSNNGKFIDPDSFINLFSKVPFSAGEIASLRRTCVWWSHVLSSNAIWKTLFQRDFVPSSHQWEQINKRINDQKGNQDSFWYSEYLSVLNHIPKVIPLPKSLKSKRLKEEKKESDDEEDWEECTLNVRTRDFTFMRLGKRDCEEPSYQVHKLAIVLSILAGNEYFPKTHSKQTEMVKVGVRAQKNIHCPERVKLIPLLQFCYAVLCREEETIFTFEDYNRIKEANPIMIEENDEDNTKKKKTKHQKSYKEAFELEEDLANEDGEPFFGVAQEIDPQTEKVDANEFTSYYETETMKRYGEEPHIGVSPNVEGPFQPFVYYLKVRGLKIEKKKERFYRWKTEEGGWAPGFFNASFDWFYHLTMDSSYNAEDGSITVQKVSGRELVN